MQSIAIAETKASYLNSPKAKAAFKAYLNKGSATVALDDDLLTLPIWQWTSTTKTASHESDTGAAILPKSPVPDDALDRVSGWKTILRRLAPDKRGYAFRLLRDVVFQHHHSTNGRWNDALGRFERWGVRPAYVGWPDHDGWRNIMGDGEAVSEAHFRRVKADLRRRGLIEDEVHLWDGQTHVWIKPTPLLSRILFEPGIWPTVQAQFTTPKKKPRGLSARHAEIDAEQAALYKDAITIKTGGPVLSSDERWAIWHRLTKPTPMSKRHNKTPFAPKGSSRYKLLYERLGLQWA
ncbi:MAG: hypothetical protein KDJ23_00230 [Rhodoblastus sp.]|nr:hypothetical protein [Rhodoblastus sp.]MCB9999834.1 hypothetical protein [Methylobacteriaceae bacterium]MCC0001535.1 hypothetical protein [Methylobacteriaceae bacterium]MCC2112426.1 hypothetical protein [Hyphomicrobiales bacterium]